MTPGSIIFKFDDILVNTMPTRYRLIRKSWSRFNRWFIDFGPQNDKDVYSRKFENIYEWLLKPVLRVIDQQTFIEVVSAIENDFNKHVCDKAVYENVDITSFAKKTIFNTVYIDSGNVENIYIIYDYRSENERLEKEQYIKKHFTHNKITAIPRHFKESMSDVLKRNKISWNLFVTDSVNDVQNVAENCVRERKEFLLPKYEYVRLPEKVKKLIEYDYGSVNYYDPFLKN